MFSKRRSHTFLSHEKWKTNIARRCEPRTSNDNSWEVYYHLQRKTEDKDFNSILQTRCPLELHNHCDYHNHILCCSHNHETQALLVAWLVSWRHWKDQTEARLECFYLAYGSDNHNCHSFLYGLGLCLLRYQSWLEFSSSSSWILSWSCSLRSLPLYVEVAWGRQSVSQR